MAQAAELWVEPGIGTAELTNIGRALESLGFPRIKIWDKNGVLVYERRDGIEGFPISRPIPAWGYGK